MKKKRVTIVLSAISMILAACGPVSSSETNSQSSSSFSSSASLSDTATTSSVTSSSGTSSSLSSSKSSSSSTASSSNASSSSQSSSSSSSSSQSSSSSSSATIAVTSVSLNQPSLEIYTDDAAITLTATVLPEDATNKSVTWSSSNNAVATVDNGVVMPISAGTTKITVKTVDGNKTAECAVTVKERTTIPNYVLHGLYYGETEWTDKPMVINPYSTTEYMIQGVSLHAGDVFKIHMYGDTWYGFSAVKSSTKSGLVTAGDSDDNIKVLTTGVYDIYSDYTESFNGHIYLGRVDETNPTPSVVNVSGISLSHSGKYLLVRNEFTITPTVYPTNASNKQITWTSSDTSIATVTSAGRVVAKEKKGSTTITAKTVDGGFTATCLIYVSPSQYPDYCLTGTVGGRSLSGLSMKYAALPISTGKYLIPDVDLVKGDEITVTDNYGARLRNRTNQIYTKKVSENMSVNVYLNVNDTNYDYLSFVTKTSN